MTVTTDDSHTLINLAKLGVITKVDLVFSFEHITFMYKIQTNL